MAKKDQKKEPMKQKEAKKIVEDQMFGMKNKGKSAKLKKMASSLEASYTKGKAKKEEEPQQYEVLQKVPAGVEPKSLVCVNFRNGVCTKEAQCKFSHELEGEKREKELKEIREKEQKEKEEREKEAKEPREAHEQEEKICKHYIDALKAGKHNAKWVCPIGNSCSGKHSPPEGYSLKEERESEITIEEYIENEKNKLPEKQTQMSEELFKKWKSEREQQKLREKREQERIKEGNIRLGKIVPSGRDLFEYNLNQFVDDEEALDCDYRAREEDIESEEEDTLVKEMKVLSVGSDK